MARWRRSAAFYDPAFAEGARAAMRELAPQLVGADAAGIEALNRRMDLLLKGHPYAKSAIDMALWDLAGKRSGLSLAAMTGGAEGTSLPLYRSIAQEAPDAMAARAQKYIEEGYRRLQVKVGLDVDEDIARLEAVRAAIPADTVLFCDANASWGTAETRRFLMATRDLDYTLEQPCATYEENLAIRRACDRPLVLDETIDGVDVLLRAHGRRAGRRHHHQARARRRADQGQADPRHRDRPQSEDHHRGHRRRRDRHRRLFRPDAVDAGRTCASTRSISTIG